MGVLRTEVLTIRKPVSDLDSIFLVVGSYASRCFGKQRDLLGTPKGVAARHQYENAVVSDELCPKVDVVADSGYPQIFLNERLIRFTNHISLHRYTFFLLPLVQVMIRSVTSRSFSRLQDLSFGLVGTIL